MNAGKQTERAAAKPGADQRPWLRIPFASNEMRLAPRLWVATLLLTIIGLWGLRLAWNRLEPVPDESNYRVPFSLGNDYWYYRRLAAATPCDARIVLLGDSVIWGHYVSSAETLAGQMNRIEGRALFANLAVNGMHPASMAGLLKYYGGAIRNGKTVVMFNPLWITSRRQDLTDKREFVFNHPDLVPQFRPAIPCYVKTPEAKLGIVLRRYLPWLGWGDHVRMAYYGNKDLGTWAADHPYRNPLAAVTFRLPPADEAPDPAPDTRPWHEKGLMLSPSWVPLADSFQWASFQQALALLQQRGNTIFVVVNPMNEHMMSEEGRVSYKELRAGIVAAIEGRGLPCFAPDTLPRDLYADSSHPLAEGYALIARQLLANEAFARFRGAPPPNSTAIKGE